MVDVSAQGSCTITPLNPTTLTTTGGALVSGTVNVMIQCICTNDDGTVVDIVRWYDPAGNKLLAAGRNRFDACTSHFTKVDGRDTHVILVIPIFTESYNGTYTCGNREGQSNNGPGSPKVTVTLTIEGELMIHVINIIIYSYV